MRIKLDPGAYLPERAHETDAGLDLKSPIDTWVCAHDRTIIDTGVHVRIPEGHVGLLTSKSGLMAKGITSRGTIDSGYTGSIRVVLNNDSEEAHAVRAGDKITQLVVLPCVIERLTVVDDLGTSERGDRGFGSTGR